MRTSRPNRLVHLELHTRDLPLAAEFYAELLRWRPERIETAHGGSYTALGLGGAVGGGIVECETPRAMWLPYVEVADIDNATALAGELGASVLLGPREGPAGWRSVIATPAGAELALWQQKGWQSRGG
jgi:predicted enzyme related to lactoylglutathione lyase